MRKTAEYIEGHAALENIEEGMKALFKGPELPNLRVLRIAESV